MDNLPQNKTGDNWQLLYFDCRNMNVGYPTTGMYKYNWLINGTVNLVLAPFTFFLNLITLIALRKVKDKRTATNYILSSLCTTDMLTGLFGQVTYGVLYLTIFHSKAFCILLLTTVGFSYFFVTVSFFTMLTIHTDRYIGVFYPFQYEKIERSCSFIWKIIFVTWIASACFVSVNFFTPHFILHTVLAAIIIPVSFTWCIYVQLNMISQVRKVTRHLCQTTPQLDGYHRRQKCNSVRLRSRTNKMVGLILGAFVICYTPNIIISILRYLDGKSHKLLTAMVWSETLVFFNSVLNPFLFCLQRKDIQQIVSNMLMPGIWKDRSKCRDIRIAHAKGKTCTLTMTGQTSKQLSKRKLFNVQWTIPLKEVWLHFENFLP